MFCLLLLGVLGVARAQDACNPANGPAVIEGISGTVASPNYPENYPDNAQCEWQLKNTAPNGRVELSFVDFVVENCENCQCDYLNIYDGGDKMAPLIGKFCGDTFTMPIFSSSELLYLEFVSDDNANTKGFIASFSSPAIACTNAKPEQITAPSGNLTSPNYPLDYTNNLDCQWVITADAGRTISITFHDFELEDDIYPDCDYDYVTLWDGPDANLDLLIDYWCGDYTPGTQVSTRNAMRLEFQTDFSITRRGWLAEYSWV